MLKEAVNIVAFTAHCTLRVTEYLGLKHMHPTRGFIPHSPAGRNILVVFVSLEGCFLVVKMFRSFITTC